MQNSTLKKYSLMGIIFSLFAIFFAILFYFNLISTMDLMLSVTYVSYFTGLALLYNGAYNRSQAHTKSTIINFAIGLIFILISIALLTYGLISGKIILF